MLTDTRIFNFYAAISRYWNDKLNTAAYNLQQDFAKYALEQLERLKAYDDTPENCALLDVENTAYETYRSVVSRAKAGIVHQAEVDRALEVFQEAKTARREVIPKTDWLINVIREQALAIKAQMRSQYDALKDANSELALITATKLVEQADDFEQRVTAWVGQNSVAEDTFEYSGEEPTAGSSKLEAYGLFSDGNYGDEINRVSPEGYLYGTSGWIQQVVHLWWWDGLDWAVIPETLDQCNSPDLLPGPPRPANEVWRVRRYVSVTNEYVWDYWFFNPSAQEWQKMVRYWDVSSRRALPVNGSIIGAYHHVIERDVPWFWDGHDIRRYRHEMLELGDDASIHVPEGFIAANQSEHQWIITGLEVTNEALITATNAINTRLDEQVEEYDEVLGNLSDQIEAFSSNTTITLAEANSLKLALVELDGECEDLIDLAELLDIEQPKETLELALTALHNAVAPWINQTSYPIDITEQQRTSVQEAFNNTQSAKTALINALSAKQADNVSVSLGEFEEYVNEELGEVNQALGTLDGQITDFSSDLIITLAEANSLKIALAQAVSESADIIDIATELEITTEKTEYETALSNLQTGLSGWIDNPPYPKGITVEQRTTIKTAFEAVSAKRTILTNAITDATY